MRRGVRSRRRWRVRYHHEMGFGTHVKMNYQPPTEHWTYAGADFHRRFRHQHLGLGSCSMWTEIEPIGEGREEPTLRFGSALGRVWSVLYWLRSRRDGLRYGLDRDRRR